MNAKTNRPVRFENTLAVYRHVDQMSERLKKLSKDLKKIQQAIKRSEKHRQIEQAIKRKTYLLKLHWW